MARREIGEGLAIVAIVLVGLVGYQRTRKAKASRPGFAWSQFEMQRFSDELGPLGVPLPALLAVYTCESGLDPKASSGSAWGICQLSEVALRAIGWTGKPSDFGKLSLLDQIPWCAKLVASQIRMIGRKPKDSIEAYWANFAPGPMSRGERILYRRGSRGYEKNRPLDRDGKGYIDVDDLATSLRRCSTSNTYKSALALLGKVERHA
jgi:hypothetical protein